MMNQKKKFNGGIQVMVWGMISNKGPVAFCIVEGRLNSEKYIEILEELVINNWRLKRKNAIF